MRAAAERRRAEAEATALLQVLWDPSAEPIRDPIVALQQLAGRLQHAANVLGARLEGSELDGPTGLAWVRVLRELRQALEGMERLDLASKVVELERAQAKMVGIAVEEALGEIGVTSEQRERFIRVMLDRLRLENGQPVHPRPSLAVAES